MYLMMGKGWPLIFEGIRQIKMKKSSDINLLLKVKHLHLLACYITTTSTTTQVFFIYFSLFAMYFEIPRNIYASIVMIVIINFVTGGQKDVYES